MRLAKELGIPNVNGMLRGISGKDLVEWMAYAELEPFGEERADLRIGILAALIANINRDPDKSEEYSPEDFMPKFVRAEEPISKEEAIAAIDAAFSAFALMSPLPAGE